MARATISEKKHRDRDRAQGNDRGGEKRELTKRR
jgi:hypothetical protein